MMLNAQKSPLKRLALVTLFAACTTATAAAQQKPCLTASKFGPDDQIGNVNYITPAKTLEATKLVTTGKTYRLAIETNKNTPAYPPRTFAVTVTQPTQVAGGSLGPTRTTYNDDMIVGWNGIGTQVDGLGHIGIDYLYYNCNKAQDFVATDGLKKLGTEHIPAIATRGIVLDMAGYFNTDIVKEGTAFTRADIEGAMKREGIASIEKGDVVLFYTGWLKLLDKDNKRYGSVGPGLGRDGARYLVSREIAMVGADTWAFEAVPFEPGAGVFEVHQILIPMSGIHILENINTEELVKDKAWQFLFTLGAPRLTGAVQAIINPIAIK